MFIISKLREDIRIHPQDLNKTPLLAVTEVIEQRFIDKVVADLGLIVSIYDVLSIEGGHIYPIDGAAYFKVDFRVVVFRPFAGEVLVGKLMSCSKDGLKVSLGFFEDVLVPEFALQEPSFWDDTEKVWFWQFDENKMHMDPGEAIRFKVHAVKFHPTPTPLQLQQGTEGGEGALLGTAAKPFAPMEVIGDINGDGLGLASWWGGEEQGGEEMDE